MFSDELLRNLADGKAEPNFPWLTHGPVLAAEQLEQRKINYNLSATLTWFMMGRDAMNEHIAKLEAERDLWMRRAKALPDYWWQAAEDAEAHAEEDRLEARRLNIRPQDVRKAAQRAKDFESAKTILVAIAKIQGEGLGNLVGPRGTDHLAHLRMISIYVIRTLSKASFPTLGKCFNRDHSTIIHSYQMIAERIQRSPAFALEIAKLTETVKATINGGDHDNGRTAANHPNSLL